MGAVIAVPFLAAALLALTPARAGAWLSFGAALLTLALACDLAVTGRAEALGAALALLAAFVAATTAWGAAHDPGPAVRGGRVEAWWQRAESALIQAMLGGALLATLADNLALGWIGLEVGVAATAAAAALPRTQSSIRAGWKRFLLGSAALGLALAGVAVLAFASGAALEPDPATMSWSGLARAAPAMKPALLNLAFCFLVVGWGTVAALVPLQGWFMTGQAEGDAAATCVLPMLLLNAALANLLRLRAIMAACPGAMAPGPVLVALGVASALVSALLLIAPQDARRFLAASTVGQSGIAAAAFGLGGDAVFAGVLHLVLHTLAKSALLQGVGQIGSSWWGDRGRAALVLAAGLAVAGLPPAGVFASEFLVLAEVMRQAPVVAALLGAGVIVAASAVMSWLRSLVLCPAAPETTAQPAALLGGWANLALALVLVLAMPGPILALLQAAAR